MKKILSVCIPTYNMEALLGRCLDSFIIEKQYMEQLEIIIVNDGSKDNSSRIAHEYAEKYPYTFVVIDKPNGNYGSCINAALKVATGTYFRICDADDRYENGNLVSYIDFLNSSKTDLVFSPYNVLTMDSELISQYPCPDIYIGKSFSVDDFSFKSRGCGELLRMHCLTTKTSILTDHNYSQTEGISYTDTQYVFYSMLYAKSLSFFGNVIYCYYLGRDGQTASKESVIRSHMHLYQNAERLINEYVAIGEKLSSNKIDNLVGPISSETYAFFKTVFLLIKDNTKQLELLQSLVERSKKSNNPCPVEDRLLNSRMYKLWKVYKLPKWLVRFLVKQRI